jgi:hypothetical protein
MQDSLYDKRDMNCHFLLDAEGDIGGRISTDEETFIQEEMFCVQISTVWNVDMFEAHNVLIVVGSEPQDEGRFRRVGAGEITQEAYFRSCPVVASIIC